MHHDELPSADEPQSFDPAWRSREVTQGLARTPHRWQLRATGLDDEGMAQPFVGVAHTFGEVSPCSQSLMPQVQAAKLGIEVGGGTAREFSTISVSDVLSQQHDGMRYSLMSREVIADSVELVMRAQRYDALVGIGACDKTIPGLLMAMVRLNLPSLFLHGGQMLVGWHKGQQVNPLRLFEGVGQVQSGQMTSEELEAMGRDIVTTAGACPGQFSSGTAGSIAEVLGFSPLGSSGIPAAFSVRQAVARFGTLFTLPHTWGIVVLGAVTYAALIALRGLWLGPMLMQRHGWSLVASGNVALALSVVALAGPVLFGRIDPPDARRRRRWLVACTLAMAALFAALATGGPSWLDVALMLAVGLLSGFIVLQYADVRAAYPADLTGRAMAVFTMAMFLGVALMQWFTGIVAAWAAAQGWEPYRAVMLAIAAWLALASLAFRRLPASPLLGAGR